MYWNVLYCMVCVVVKLHCSFQVMFYCHDHVVAILVMGRVPFIPKWNGQELQHQPTCGAYRSQRFLSLIGMVLGEVPPRGVVSLTDKQCPTCERDVSVWRIAENANSDNNKPALAYLRGVVDVKPFQDKLNSMDPAIWDDEHQEGNVKLVRPAHDAWGVKKIVFNFCDDVSLVFLSLVIIFVNFMCWILLFGAVSIESIRSSLVSYRRVAIAASAGLRSHRRPRESSGALPVGLHAARHDHPRAP